MTRKKDAWNWSCLSNFMSLKRADDSVVEYLHIFYQKTKKSYTYMNQSRIAMIIKTRTFV